MKTSFQSNSFAYFEIIFHPGLQMKESGLKSESGMHLYFLLPNLVVLQASLRLQHSEFWVWIMKKKRPACLSLSLQEGLAAVGSVTLDGLDCWEGIKRADRSNHTAFTSAFPPLIPLLKASEVLQWKSSSGHSLTEVYSACLFVFKYDNLSYSVCISAKLLLLPRFQHIFIS